MDKNLPARPNLDYLRRQAKTLLKQLGDGDTAAARAFIEHLPAAHGKKPAAICAAGFKLADAQSVVARQAGYASWPVLVRHVEQLRALEGEWHFDRLEIDGNAVPVTGARILMDGDRFRTESPEATYEGIFTIDVETAPARIDIAFVSGPEAGNTSHGIFVVDGEVLTICFGLTGAARPTGFTTSAGSGHALEHLRRTSKARPENVTGGTPPPPAPEPERGDPTAFEMTTPTHDRLQGTWSALELAIDGRTMPASFLAGGTRTMTGNELKVVFGGQTMVHAKVRIDDTASPTAVDYLGLSGKQQGAITRGIMEWVGDEVRFLMAPAGAPRPASFTERGTLTRWRKRG